MLDSSVYGVSCDVLRSIAMARNTICEERWILVEAGSMTFVVGILQCCCDSSMEARYGHFGSTSVKTSCKALVELHIGLQVVTARLLSYWPNAREKSERQSTRVGH